MGFSIDIETPGGFTHVVLGFNPSHLEIISPVVEGSVRARQDRQGRPHPRPCDADSGSWGFRIFRPGAWYWRRCRCPRPGIRDRRFDSCRDQQPDRIHHIESARYPIHVILHRRWKMVQTPIFHVNGDDPEAVIFVTQSGTGLPHAFSQGRHHRSGLLPPPRAITKPTNRRSPNLRCIKRSGACRPPEAFMLTG